MLHNVDVSSLTSTSQYHVDISVSHRRHCVHDVTLCMSSVAEPDPLPSDEEVIKTKIQTALTVIMV